VKKLLVLTLLLGLTVAASSSCARYRRFAETRAVVRVMEKRQTAIWGFIGITKANPTIDDVNKVLRAHAGRPTPKVEELGKVLEVIDVSGCPSEFKSAWNDYIGVMMHAEKFPSPLAHGIALREANDRLAAAARDAGATPPFR